MLSVLVADIRSEFAFAKGEYHTLSLTARLDFPFIKCYN